MGRQLDLLQSTESGPGLSPEMRAALVPMLARLLLEAVVAGPTAVEDMVGKEADDEPDRS